MNTVLNNLIELLNFHSNQYSLVKQGEYFSSPCQMFDEHRFVLSVLVSSNFMELFLSDDVYICPLMINTFEDIVRKSR